MLRAFQRRGAFENLFTRRAVQPEAFTIKMIEIRTHRCHRFPIKVGFKNYPCVKCVIGRQKKTQMRVLCTCIILFFLLLPKKSEKSIDLFFFSVVIGLIIDFSKSVVLRYILITTYCFQLFIVLLFPMIHLLLQRLS